MEEELHCNRTELVGGPIFFPVAVQSAGLLTSWYQSQRASAPASSGVHVGNPQPLHPLAVEQGSYGAQHHEDVR